MGATELWLIRHGESVANVAAAVAERDKSNYIVTEFRDADVPLSETGERQAKALGLWLSDNAADRLGAVWSSPYLRARQTVAAALDDAGLRVDVRVDERLRDRELGVLDLMTSIGVDTLLPAEAARRRRLGKFFYRPPGGESWADVALRVRSLLNDLDRDAELVARPDADDVILVACHDAVIMLFLYVCLGMSETDLLEFAQTHTVSNASVTRLVRPSGTGWWKLDDFAHERHLEESGVPVTHHSGDKDASIH